MSLKTIFRQSSITRKRFKNLGKTIGIALFALLMFTNIKIALLDDNEIASGDISLFGIEMQLFDATYGETGSWIVKCEYNYSASGSVLAKKTCTSGGTSACECPGE